MSSYANLGNIPSFLHQIDISTLDPGDIIGATIGSIALIVSAITFYISHTQSSQGEQIKTTRDIWERISEKDLKYLEEKSSKLEDNVDVIAAELDLLSELDYLAYFILRGEIKDKVVLDYYRPKLTNLIKMSRRLGGFKSFVMYPNIPKLLKKWRIQL